MDIEHFGFKWYLILLKCNGYKDDIVEIVRWVFAVDGMSIVVYNCVQRRFMRQFCDSVFDSPLVAAFAMSSASVEVQREGIRM